MADDLTAAPSESASAAPAEAVSAPSSESSSSAPEDTRAIAAHVLRESQGAPAASPAVDPSSTPPTPAAARSDGEDDADYLNLLASGSMPVDRHKAVLTNARNKTRAEVEREFQQKYGWADQIDRTRAEHGLGILNGLDKNAEQTLRHLASVLGVNLAPPAAQEPEGPPPPDVRLEDGSEFYSAKQLSKLRVWQDAQYDKKLEALEKRWKPIEEERVLAKMRETSHAEAGNILQRYRSTRQHFAALENDIKALMVADPNLDLPDAYSLALETKLIPQQLAQASTDRASQLQRKAAASTAPPGSARPVTPQRDRDRDTRDIAREVLTAMR